MGAIDDIIESIRKLKTTENWHTKRNQELLDMVVDNNEQRKKITSDIKGYEAALNKLQEVKED